MRRLATIAALICLLPVEYVSAQTGRIDNMEVRAVSDAPIRPDTINGTAGILTAGSEVTFIFSAQTTGEWHIFRGGFEFHSPDGSIDSLVVVSGPDVYFMWDGGFDPMWLSIPKSFDSLLPESFFVKWEVLLPETWSGYVSPDLMDALIVTVRLPAYEEGTLCIDTTLYKGYGEYCTSSSYQCTIVPQWGASVGGYSADGLCFTVAPDPNCCDRPGDANRDRRVNIGDITYSLQLMFAGGAAPTCCREGDVSGDGAINVGDIAYLFTYIFTGSPSPVCGPLGMTCGTN